MREAASKTWNFPFLFPVSFPGAGRKAPSWRPFAWTARSLDTANETNGPLLPPFSLVPNSRFPETETAVAETGSTELLLSGEAEHLALA